MSSLNERKFLRAVLNRIDHGPSKFFAAGWSGLVIWLALVVCSVVAFSVAPHLSPYISALIFLVIGVAYAHLYFKVAAARGWPVLARYLDRGQIVSRLEQLGP